MIVNSEFGLEGEFRVHFFDQIQNLQKSILPILVIFGGRLGAKTGVFGSVSPGQKTLRGADFSAGRGFFSGFGPLEDPRRTPEGPVLGGPKRAKKSIFLGFPDFHMKFPLLNRDFRHFSLVGGKSAKNGKKPPSEPKNPPESRKTLLGAKK